MATIEAVSTCDEDSPQDRLSLSTPAHEVQRLYAQYGYVVLKGTLPSETIDHFLQSYNAIRHNPFFIYYSQSYQRCMRPKLSPQGFIVESMQNASRLAIHRSFCRTFQQCIYHERVAQALSLVSGEQAHVSWQNMFFDQSTGTVEHQDSWYLDTEPAGGLMGVWYALEDIQEGSGPFFVSPGSHHCGLIDRARYPNHDDFVRAIQEIIAENNLQLRPMLLQRGDILIWNSLLIHGAFSQQNAALSRKSFTSHFYPRSAKAKDTEQGKRLSIYNHAAPRPTATQGLYTAYAFPDLVYTGLVYGKYVVDSLRHRNKYLDMGRRAYA